MFNLMNDRDYELINAYIDGALTEAERRMFESRLSAEPDLQHELNSLRQTVTMLRQMPELKAPRNFTLTPAQVETRPAPRTALPFPLTATFSALSAAAAVLLFVFGGYFLLQSNMMPMTSNLNTSVSMQQEVQQAASTGVALALTATPVPTSSPMPTLPPPTALADLAQTEGENAPAAAMAPPGEVPEDASGTIMMYETDDGEITPEADEETAAFRLVVTDSPAQSEALEMDAAADTAANGAGAAMMATQSVLPNPMMTDAALLGTLGVNLAQYANTPLPGATARPDIQSERDESSTQMQAEATLEMPSVTAAPTEAALQTGADQNDAFAELTPESPVSVQGDRTQFAPAPDITGPLLLGVGGLLLVIAIGTTIVRRRRST